MSFASLTTGIRFNKKTNSKTQALFQQPATAPADLTGDLDDFFQAAEPSRKRRKLDDEPLDAETTDADAFRKLYRIKTTGTDVPAPVASFLDLESLQTLPEHVKSNLRALEFKTPTPIQSQAVPIMLQVSINDTKSTIHLTQCVGPRSASVRSDRLWENACFSSSATASAFVSQLRITATDYFVDTRTDT